MSDQRSEVARVLEQVATEFEAAARHVRVAANHMRGGEVPRFAAHVLAAQGHALNAAAAIEDIARMHASKAIVDEGPSRERP